MFAKRSADLTAWPLFLGFKNSDSARDCRTFLPSPRPPQVDLTAQSRGQVQPSGQGDQTVSSTDRFCENVRFTSTKRPFL